MAGPNVHDTQTKEERMKHNVTLTVEDIYKNKKGFICGKLYLYVKTKGYTIEDGRFRVED